MYLVSFYVSESMYQNFPFQPSGYERTPTTYVQARKDFYKSCIYQPSSSSSSFSLLSFRGFTFSGAKKDVHLSIQTKMGHLLVQTLKRRRNGSTGHGEHSNLRGRANLQVFFMCFNRSVGATCYTTKFGKNIELSSHGTEDPFFGYLPDDGISL